MGGPHSFEEEINHRNRKVQTSLLWYFHGWNDGFDFLVVSHFPLYPSQNHKDQNADSIQNGEEHSMRKYLFMSFQPRLCASHLCPMLTNTGPCPFLALLVLPREKAMAPRSTTLASEIPRMEEPGGLQSMGSRRVGHDWAPSLWLSLSCAGEGNGNPLQCSCLENPGDGSLVGCRPWGRTESDTIGVIWQQQQQPCPISLSSKVLPWTYTWDEGNFLCRFWKGEEVR